MSINFSVPRLLASKSFVASAILQAKLSNFYLDYKKDIPEIEASIEEN